MCQSAGGPLEVGMEFDCRQRRRSLSDLTNSMVQESEMAWGHSSNTSQALPTTVFDSPFVRLLIAESLSDRKQHNGKRRMSIILKGRQTPKRLLSDRVSCAKFDECALEQWTPEYSNLQLLTERPSLYIYKSSYTRSHTRLANKSFIFGQACGSSTQFRCTL